MTKRRQTSDGRVMTLPELRINEGSLSPDTIFTVSGASPWGSTSKYNVVLNGPNSYYTYKASQLETDENGDEIRSWVTKTGNDPKRLARYRLYVKEGEQANDYTSGWEDFLRAIGLKKKDGGWLDKFQDGGTTLQQSVSPEQDVMNTIDAAIGEIQTKRPGQAVQKLAAMMQDPNYSMIIDMIKQEYPQIEGILNKVEQMVGAYKCGGKTKKKVKKGAKGCVPCKKLMRVGGKLINVLTDCEGNIISKHLAGGWLIPKGLVGLTAQFVQEPYRKAKASTDTGNANDVHYYLNDDNKIYMQTYTAGTGWGAGKSADMNNFKDWATTANTSGQILGKNFFVNGFNFDYNTNMGTMSEADAQAAGIDATQFKTSLGTRGKYEASYNPLFGESKPSEVAITQGYINSLGGMNAAVKHERQQRRKDRQAQRAEHRAYNSAARLSTKDTETSNDVNVLTADQKLTNLNNIDTNYANEASRMAAAMKAKWANYNVGTPASATPANSVTNRQRDVLKQGGWLTKFLDGGHMDYETKSNISGTTWEQRVDRDNTGAIYRYNPGRTSHVVTLQTTGLPAINPNRFVKYEEERYYLTDPKTGRVIKIEGPTIDQRVEEVVPIVNSSIIEDQISPSQDIFIFPGGFTKVTPAAPVQKPGGSKKSKKPEKNIEGPKQEVPTQPNDNTSTSGSKTPGNIRQGNYPVYESLPAPDGYDSSNEWVEERDLVNGQVRVTWRNKKTGEIRRAKPYKHGGWLTKFN